MNIKRVKPIIIKEFRQIRRDKRSLGVLLVFPAFLVLLIGYALNFDVKHISVAVFDQDKTQSSREFVRSFSNSEYFDFNYSVQSYEEIDKLLDEGKVLVVFVIPTNFSKELLAGRDAKLQILVDGSNSNTATTAIGYSNAIVQAYSMRIALETLARSGKELYVPIDLHPKVWYNPELISAKFLVPGLIGFILMLSAVVSTSLSVVREKERGTMDQMMVSPLKTGEIILGKTISYLIIALVASVLVLLIGYFFFDISIRGSIIWLYVGIFIFLLAALGQGLLISAISHTQQVAFIISVFSTLLPALILSGFVFPIRSMPIALQVISNVTPPKFFLIVIRDVILKGVGPAAFWEQLVYMGIFAAVTLGLSTRLLLKRAN
ncbi:MAG: ABC transporter permease [Bacteroidota bacterium]|nr:ABC transporter permease [Bacteroidota bacterium]